MKKKRVTALVLCAILATGLLGCADKKAETNIDEPKSNEIISEEEALGATAEGEKEESADKKIVKIAWCDDTMDQTRAIMLDAAKERVEEINQERQDIQIELTYYDAQKSVEKQLSDVETALLGKPDAVIFSCVDASGSIPAIELINKAGVKIIDIRDIGQPELVDCTFYGADEQTYANVTKSWLKKYLEANPDIVIKAGLIYGAAAQTQQFARCDLVKELAKEMPDRVQILDEKYGDWDMEKSMNITEDWLQSQPEMNYIACANDIMALGASNALVAAQKKDKVLVTGVDVTDEGVDRIKQNQMDCTVGARLEDYGQMIDCALGIFEGTYTEPTYMIEEVYAVDSTNVENYLNGTILPYKVD